MSFGSSRGLLGRGVLAAASFLIGSSRLAGANDLLSLTSLEAAELQAAGRLLIIDVRSAVERAERGAPRGSWSVPLSLGHGGEEIFASRVEAIVEHDRSRPLGIICRIGVTSRKAQAVLLQRGFTQVFNIHDGYAGNEAGPGWQQWGLPVEH